MLDIPPSLSAAPPTLAFKIEDAERQIKQAEATIANLSADGHEITDAARHLNELLGTLTNLVRTRMKAR